RDLATYAVVEQSTLSWALDGLGGDGLIRRETDKDDSRATRVFITEQGRAAFERHWPAMASAYEKMFQNISEDERQAFVATLQKILRNVRRREF
ncbi:MAG: MarR family winged helix-turn-helix transcriptional regulator, partial [Pseudodonghicola sp.]